MISTHCLPRTGDLVKMSAEHTAMLTSWVKIFVTTLLASFLALATPPWELEGTQWLSILWSGLLGVAIVVYNYLDPKDSRYGHGGPVAPAPMVSSPAVPELKVAPAPRAAAAKRAPAATKAAPAPKKAPAKKAPGKK